MELLLFSSYLLMGVAACATNGCLITTVLCTRTLRTVTNVIVASLATSDFLVAIVVVPFEIAHHVGDNGFHPQGYGCLIHEVVQNFIPLVSIFHLILIAVERFLKIVYPLKYLKFATRPKVITLLIISWLVPLFISIVPLCGWNNADTMMASNTLTNETISIECEKFESLPCSYLGMMFTTISIIYITMIGLYIKIFAIALSQAKRIDVLSYSKLRTPRLVRSEIKALLVLATTVGYFFVSWCPLGGVIARQCLGDTADDSIWTASFYLAYLNSTVNPIIYGIGNRDIRKRFLKKIVRRKKQKTAVTLITDM